MDISTFRSRRILCSVASALALLTVASRARAEVQISEFMADNVSVLQDEDLEYSDWIELYNAGGTAVDLTGWHLTDSITNLVRWTFPATNLPAGGFLLVYASGKDKTATNLHANFRLSAGGEYLALVHPDGTNVECEVTRVSNQFPDISYGIQTHGANPTLRTGLAGYLIYHTPGTANTCLPAPHPLYSDDSVAQVDIDLSQSAWDELMNDPWNETYQTVEVRFRHGDIDLTVTNAGIRCRGNSSREHQPRSFNIAFDAFVPGQKLLDLERMNLNADANDPTMARPKLLNDLNNTRGLPAPNANHVALVVHGPNRNRGHRVDGVFFDAVRNNTQPVDDVFLRQRFGTSRGNLYKCNNRNGDVASLEYRGPTGSSYSSLGSGETYELRYAGSGDFSYDDLADFIALINQTATVDFAHAIYHAFDVEAFLQQLALDVLTGHWDDYWINANNYNLFHNPETRRWAYIPYDFDNAMGTRWLGDDWGNQNIYSWTSISEGHPNAPLAARLMAVPEFKNRYSFYMKEILDAVYSSAILDPAIFHTRAILTNALPFDIGSVTNIKIVDRLNYGGDWPYWSYDQFYWSYQSSQEEYSDVPNYYGMTEFISTRRASALSQLDLQDISPILSDFKMTPSLPRTNDAITISMEARDDSAVTNVSFVYSFGDAPTQTVEMAPQTDGSFETHLPAFETNGTLRYLIRATDDAGQSTTHPYGGSPYAASLQVQSAAFNLTFSEVNYHPQDPTPAEIAAGHTDADDFEFVEFYNAGHAPLDLTGYMIQDGITATFPFFILTNGAYAVMVANADAFRARYTNEAIRIIGLFTGKLSDSGETLTLEDNQGGEVLSFFYGDSGAWPGRADGDGSTLEALAPGIDDPNLAASWRSSSEINGNPGFAGKGADNRVVINEVLTHTDPPLCDKIELYNTTESAIDISGWALSDSATNFVKFVIPTGTVLAAANYMVFNETNDFNTSTGVAPDDFALNSAHGDDVFLIETDAQGDPLRFVDRVKFGAAANGESFGRWPNGLGRLVPMTSRTFNAVNSGPRTGPLLLNEIMYNPPSSNDSLEFVEILNPTPLPVDLTRWELDGGVDYTFPSNTVIGAGGTLTIIPFNPWNSANSARLATFRTTYSISTNIPLVGGYDGQLDNGGERLRLLRPDEPPIGETNFYPMLIEDETAYDDDAPWPLSADAGGASLIRLSPAGWGDAPTSWTAALPPSPGSNGDPPDTHIFTVVSSHGRPSPSVGTHTVLADTPFANSVASPEYSGGYRYSCTGWTASGNDPLSGTTNSVTMTLTNDATFTWLWDTNFMLSVSSVPGGHVLPEGGWQSIGAVVELAATASNGYSFAYWDGDTNAITAGAATSTVVSVTVDAPILLTAIFSSIVPTYYASPGGTDTAPYTNWTMAATSLQALIDYVPVNSTVVVAAATWPLSSQLSIAKAVHLRSADGPASTLLDGGDSTRVLYLSHAGSIAEGFTIQNANSGDSSGGGVRIDPDGLLTDCILRDNSTGKSGGGCAVIWEGEVRNCLFYNNTAGDKGGSIYTFTTSGAPLIHSCTASGNTADDGGGVYMLNAATLQNSIVWGNSSLSGNSNIYLEGAGQTITFTDSGPAQSGTANTGTDPFFVDATADDFRISPDSPLINAGTVQSWMTGATDLDGSPRVLYGTVDPGAFEALVSTVDSDGDSICDWQESLAGTDPFSSGSVLSILNVGKDSPTGQFVVSWSSSTGRSYRIGYGTNLVTPFAVAYSNIAATPPANTFTGTYTRPGFNVFRIELE